MLAISASGFCSSSEASRISSVFGYSVLIFFLFFTVYMSLTTQFFVSDFWRCLVPHMWVEVTFDILTTVIVAYLYRDTGPVSKAKAEIGRASCRERV